jgi:hypothetical protein
MDWSTKSNEEFVGGYVTGQDDGGSLGAGRAKLRLSRGFRRRLDDYDVTPQWIGLTSSKGS